MSATGTPTPNLGLRIPLGTDPAAVEDINYNAGVLDTKIGAIGNDTVKGLLDHAGDEINALGDGLAIIANSNTHAAIAAGEFVFVRNHGSLATGLYKATTAIAANGALSSSNLAADSKGGLNSLSDQIAPIDFNLANKDVYVGDVLIAPAGVWRVGGAATNKPINESGYIDVYVRSTAYKCIIFTSDSSIMYINTCANNTWSGWQELALNSKMPYVLTKTIANNNAHNESFAVSNAQQKSYIAKLVGSNGWSYDDKLIPYGIFTNDVSVYCPEGYSGGTLSLFVFPQS